MKIKLLLRSRASAGYVLLMVLVMVAASFVILGGTLRRTYTVARINERNAFYSANLNAAEAATELVISRMRYDYINGGDFSVTNNVGNGTYAGMVPTTNQSSYWSSFQFSDGQGNLNRNYVASISNKVFTVLQAPYAGLSGWNTVYRVLSNVSQPQGFLSVTGAVQEDFATQSIPIFQFAIFYNSLMEFINCATFTINGRVHANGPLYVGSSAQLTFNSLVSTTSTITSPAWDGYTTANYTTPTVYNGTPTPGYSTNYPVLNLPIGTNMANGVHGLIEIPPSGESATSATGEQRLYNLAQVVLLVTDTNVSLKIQASANGTVPGSDSSPVTLTITNLSVGNVSSNFPFLSLTNTFTDQREASKTVKATQIDVGLYAKWIATNASVLSKFPTTSSNYPTILFAADNRTVTSSQMTAIRLMDGTNLPYNGGLGFSVATPDPLYVWGNYNCTNAAYLGSTNVAASVPAALMSDALTVLSPNWVDSLSSGSFTARTPTTETINAAILTGIVYTTGVGGTSFSGGVMNLPRLLENWGSGTVNLWLNTSIVNMYASMVATNQFQSPGNYYYAPTRHFAFNPSYISKPPPGTPNLSVVSRSSYATPPANTLTYYVTP